MAKSRGVLSALVILFGSLLLISGAIFTLQGYGIVGPRASFMYSSSTWVYQGILILLIGAVVVGAGLIAKPRKRPVVQVGAEKNEASESAG